MDKLLVYVNGLFLPEDEAKVSVLDYGFLYSDAIFEGIAVNGGKVLMLDEHIDRLWRSASYLALEVPLSKDNMKEIILTTLRKNLKQHVTYVRPMITAGTGPLGISSGLRQEMKPSIFVIPAARNWAPLETIEKGIRLITSSTRRIPPQSVDPKAKLTSYVNNILALREARAAGADDALMLDVNGLISECTTSNLFIVENGILHTPQSINILPGITRASIIKMCAILGREVEERDLTLYDAYNADEVFICGSLSGIVPVVEVDGRRIVSGKPGPITQEFRRKLTEYWLSTGTAF